MAKKTIRFNESELRGLVKESIKKYLNEGYAPDNSDSLDTNDLLETAERLEKYSGEIKAFVQEYKVLYGELMNASKRLGLTLRDVEIDDDRFKKDVTYGIDMNYIFNFGIDPRTLYGNDEQYDAYIEKAEKVGAQLEDALNPDHFNTCIVKVHADEEIRVKICFNVWD